ncbi:MAG: hypothetical protein JSV27_01660 [Candidatus Bathyarchaeota archaeon]|nr:MAG: hypothetical protein JSV27_01660 [Candidatus Bathyarchaeota archaeon]
MSQPNTIFSRIREFFNNLFDDSPIEISSEREEEIINKVVNSVTRFDLELPFLLVGRPFIPTSTLISEVIIAPFAGFLEMFGVNGFELVAFLNKKDNLRRLMNKIEEIKEAKETDVHLKKS